MCVRTNNKLVSFIFLAGFIIVSDAQAQNSRTALGIAKEKCASEVGSSNPVYGTCVITYLKVLKEKILEQRSEFGEMEIKKAEELQSKAWDKAMDLFPEYLLKATAAAVATQVIVEGVSSAISSKPSASPDPSGSSATNAKGLKYGPVNPNLPTREINTPLPNVGNFGHNIPMGWTQ